MDTTIKLELQFATEEGKSRTLSVNQPAMDLDQATVEAAMELSQHKIYLNMKVFSYTTK